MCLLSRAQVCITTNRPRTGTFRKGLEEPPRNRMVAAAAVRK
jgi:hypothetical protein